MINFGGFKSNLRNQTCSDSVSMEDVSTVPSPSESPPILSPKSRREYTSQNAKTETLCEYLYSYPHSGLFDNIFRNVSVVKAVFGSLSNIERLFIIRLIHICEPLRWNPFVVWFGGDTRTTLKVLTNLRKKRILQSSPLYQNAPSEFSNVSSSTYGEIDSSAGVPSTVQSSVSDISSLIDLSKGAADVRYSLHPTLRKTLHDCLARGISIHNNDPDFTIFASVDGNILHPSIQVLHNHAASQWDNLLRWIVGDTVIVKYGHNWGSDVSDDAEREIITGGDVVSHQHRIHHKKYNLAQNKQPTRQPSQELQMILQRMGLVSAPQSKHRLADRGKCSITTDAFQWFLKDHRSQIVSLCVEFMHFIEASSLTDHTLSSKMDSSTKVDFQTAVHDSLILFFSVSEADIGQPFASPKLTITQKRLLRFMWDIGLVWIHRLSTSEQFYSSPSALLLRNKNSAEMKSVVLSLSTESRLRSECEATRQCAGDGEEYSHQGKEAITGFGLPLRYYHSSIVSDKRPYEPQQFSPTLGLSPKASYEGADTGIVVESNFKIFVYTGSPLLLSVLSNLCELKMISPFFVVGTLTRESSLSCYKQGITAEQITRFLTSHAHPAVIKKRQAEGRPVVPEDVFTQLKMWEQERRRITIERGSLFEFSSNDDLDIYPAVVAKAKLGWCAYYTPPPANSDLDSAEFNGWKQGRLEALTRYKSQMLDPSNNISVAPVVVVYNNYKEAMAHFIRSETAKLKKRHMVIGRGDTGRSL